MKYYKTIPGSDTHNALVALYDRMKQAREAQKALCTELGFNEWCPRNFVYYGGIYGFIPVDKKTKPKGWCWAFEDRTHNAIMPDKRLKANKELIEKIDALPVIEYSEVNEILNYDKRISQRPNPNGGHGTLITFTPHVSWIKDGPILIKVTLGKGKNHEPPAGLEEITAGSYLYQLQAELDQDDEEED